MAQMYMVTITHPETSEIVFRTFAWIEGMDTELIGEIFREALRDIRPELEDVYVTVKTIQPGDPEIRPEDMRALRMEALRGLVQGPIGV